MEVQVQRSAGGCGCGGCISAVFSLGMAIVMPILIFGAISMGRAGSDQAALEAMNACAAVTDVLGSPIEKSQFSMGCGESSSGGGSGQARWSMRVVGPKGSANASYVASYTGGAPWTIDSATVDTDAGPIAAVPCASPSTPPAGDRPKGRPKRR